MCVKSSSMFERMKRKENKEWKEKYDETRRSGNIEDKMFVVFESISKTKWKDKKNSWLLTTNDSINMLTS